MKSGLSLSLIIWPPYGSDHGRSITSLIFWGFRLRPSEGFIGIDQVGHLVTEGYNLLKWGDYPAISVWRRLAGFGHGTGSERPRSQHTSGFSRPPTAPRHTHTHTDTHTRPPERCAHGLSPIKKANPPLDEDEKQMGFRARVILFLARSGWTEAMIFS